MKIIRRHRNRKQDDKGERRLIGGQRFRIPVGSIRVNSDYGLRFDRIECVFRDNANVGDEWTAVALHAAEHFWLGAD